MRFAVIHFDDNLGKFFNASMSNWRGLANWHNN